MTTALYLQDLRSQPGQDLDRWITRVRHARPGLEGFMERWWREQSRLWDDTASTGRVDDARCLYSLLALARGPLSEGELRLLASRVLDAEVSGDRVRSALGLLDRFTLPGPERATVALAHPLLAEARVRQLRDSDELDPHRQAFTDWGREILDGLWDGGLAPAGVPRYLTRHLVQHLVPDPASGTEPDAADAPEYFTDALRLVDPRWRRVREATDDDIDGYRRDVARVAAAARRADQSAFQAGRPLPRLPEQVMCAAVLAGERTALSDEMTPALAAQLVRHGLWRRGRAMAYLASLETPRGYDCVTGFAHLAPLAGEEDLPELRRLLVRLDHRYPEELAEATAAYTRRLLELGRPLDAVAEADWLAERPARDEQGRPRQHEHRAFVRVWALGELIPDLPAEQARAALRTVLREAVQGWDVTYAVCHLTKHVTRRRAEELWPPTPYGRLPDWVTARFSEDRLASYADDPTGVYGPAEVLIAALDGATTGRPSLFLWGNGDVDGHGYAAGARWLGERIRGEILYVALATDDRRGMDFDLRRMISVDLNYDGLMSVVPERYAAWAAERIAERMTDDARTRALIQLLPALQGEERRMWAEEVFAHTDHFTERRWGGAGRWWDIAHVYAPALAAAGYTGRVLDLVEAGAFDADDGWIQGLAPGLTRTETERALTLTSPDPGRRSSYPPRRYVLPRLASFGPEQAARALACVYGQAEPQGMPCEVRWLLEHFLPDSGHQANGRSSSVEVWWEDLSLLGPGIRPVYESGVQRCPVGPRPRAELPADGAPTGTPQQFLDFAYGIASTLPESKVPHLLELAGGVFDPWARLTLLAAGTHLPSGAGYERVRTEILAVLADLRRETLESEVSLRDRGFSAQGPWLVRGTGDWAPFFARLLAPRARPEIKELLFDGGFLEGVERTHYGPWSDDGHQRLDDWAYRLQPLAPLLDRAELDAVLSLTRGTDIRSTTARVSLRAALASCYAVCGEYDRAFELCQRLGWQTNDFLHHALADIAVLLPAELIPRWASEVHRLVGDSKERGPLWSVVSDRWPELDRHAMWRMVDQWTSDLPHDSAGGVYADALFYRYAMARLGGEDEPRRLLDLIDSTTPGTGRPPGAAEN
ncbi:hypothetical protein GCM10010129_40100 [Streptomyces fumigatiscleroticus]|nr:hypothetical protein GCM10010129_40100 [Streptomyces fumigatiscleroticus]